MDERDVNTAVEQEPDTAGASRQEEIDKALDGLDELETHRPKKRPIWLRVWSATWPKLAATGLVVAVWQLVVWLGWRPDYVLPPPADVAARLVETAFTPEMLNAVAVTMQRAALGFAIAILIGGIAGTSVSRFPLMRRAVGTLITGLQSMPSIAWFPLAILMFGLTESAILFVVVLGAAPAVANGVISGVDHIPGIQLQTGRMLGLRGPSLYRNVVIPSAMPSVVAGLKQAWAFAWRSLMAGELLVIIANRPSIGVQLQYARELSDATGLVAVMIVILLIGVAVDSLAFGTADRAIRKRRGLLPSENGGSWIR